MGVEALLEPVETCVDTSETGVDPRGQRVDAAVDPRAERVDLGYDASYSPDGTTILYQRVETLRGKPCWRDYGVTWVVDAESNRPRNLLPKAAEEFRGSSAAAGWSPDGTRIA